MYVLLLNEHFLLTPRGSSQCGFLSLWLPRSNRCRLAEPLSFPGCHAQVNPWSPTLKCIGGRPERAIPRLAPSPPESVEGAWHQGGCTLPWDPLSSSQTGAIKISPHYLRQDITGLCWQGRGKGREGLGVGDTESVVCVSFRKGSGGCCEIQEEVQHFSAWHSFDTSSYKAQAKQLGLT